MAVLHLFNPRRINRATGTFDKELPAVTKKEIVKQISDELELTQLKTKEIVQKTFDAIIETLLREKRIELRNFGVFEVKRRKPRKARNPRTGERVDVEAKNVVTFKPGKAMEERVRNLRDVSELTADESADMDGEEEAALAGAAGRSRQPASTS
jgi:integration host factor subunit beta